MKTGSLITVSIYNKKEGWSSSRANGRQYGSITIDGKTRDIEFLVNGSKSYATIIVEDGVNGSDESQQLARMIFNGNKISIDTSSIGGDAYSFTDYSP